MNLTTVLCPLDFSAASAPLMRYATALAVAAGAELRLIHVLEPQPKVLTPSASHDLEVARQLATYRASAEEAGARVSTVLLQGEAATEIVAEAKRHPADLVVIGAHGQTGLTRFLMGSTAEAVVRAAPCATLLVKPCAADTQYRQSA
ncbi:universal stress protein [Hymenobacter cavernae]|uniref:Universal stress protein n=1 Tax=Hymenobacter cavernae TaxID=2044852 RepID=A0ABQ1TW31_9BACT|nr:universal stress protein [Hymenobacter cavernae]GGF05257.1 universal stress protein [Hymenobacter cavernae]